MAEHDQCVYMAKLAEQAERYDGLLAFFCSPFVFAESCKMGHNRWNFAVCWSIDVFLSMLLSVQIAVVVNC